MSKRGVFKNIISGTIHSFISRNNDVDGYWGIGKLYSHMLASGSMTLTIDLLKQEIYPPNDHFRKLLSKYSFVVKEKLHRANLLHRVKSAKIDLIVYPNECAAHLGSLAPNRMRCTIEIVDDAYKKHSFALDTWCRPFDPLKELRSTRADSYLN